MTRAQPLLSPGWSHYFISAPLSPKARVNLNRKLRDFSDRDRGLKTLPAHALSIPILDLGVLPEATEPHIREQLRLVTQSYASLQVHAGAWTVERGSNGGFLWLAWQDRVGALQTMRRELERALRAHCPDLTSVLPNKSGDDSGKPNDKYSDRYSEKKYREHFAVLCGALSDDNSKSYDGAFRGSAWLNDICLKKRPQHFDYETSYQVVWRHTLPLELPPLTESDLDADASGHTAPSRRAPRSPDEPLDARSSELLEQLERNLEQLARPSSPSPHSTTTKPKRRRRRQRKRPLNAPQSAGADHE